jgi:type IV pilus assembly protein PilE
MVTTMRSSFATASQAILGNPEVMPHVMETHSCRPAHSRSAWRKLAGFTLIELMIVVAIVAILAAIAIPAYQKQILQSRRTSAKTALLDLSGREERYYAANNTYDPTLTDFYTTVDGTGALQVPNNTNEDYYSVTIAVTPATGTTPASYVATAVPVNSQAADATGCGNYSITDLGVQGNTGTNSGAGTGCW